MMLPIDDFEDFLRIEEEAQRKAAEQIQSWQRDLKPGDLFYRRHPVGIDIFGEVLQVTDGEELPDYRFVRAFSEACPKGELGEIHISVVTKVLTPDEFAAARERGWKLIPD